MWPIYKATAFGRGSLLIFAPHDQIDTMRGVKQISIQFNTFTLIYRNETTLQIATLFPSIFMARKYMPPETIFDKFHSVT
jgi:hypothetical protein